MPFNRPSLPQLVTRIGADIEARLPGADAKLRRTFEGVMARVLAGATHGAHGHLAFLADQIIPDTAESEFLRRWARIWLGDEAESPASAAVGSILVTGSAGSPLPAETEFQRADAVLFTTDALATIPVVAPFEVSVNVTATETGIDGNSDVGTNLSLVSAVAGIDADATVEGPGGLTGGSDQESDESLLARLLARISDPPSGGGPGDYVAEALKISGITRAFELPNQLGAGTVLVLVVDDSRTPPAPSAAKIAEVQAALVAFAPVTAVVTTAAPLFKELDAAISLDPDPATAEGITASANVDIELDDLLVREAIPGGTTAISKLNEAISVAPGENDHVLTSPTVDVTTTTTELLILGTTTFVAL